METSSKLLLTGLVIGIVSTAGTVQAAPSFDCSKAATAVENMICDHQKIAQLDSDLADAYKTALRDSPWASANRRIRAEQKQWIAQRNRCETPRCLRQSYHQRISVLYGEVAGSGPDSATVQAALDTMKANCRDRAAHVFHTRQSNIDTKYEGQRTDGTHAVNGTVYLRSVEETFQCSFNSDGTKIGQFIVN
ncbi:lysozyme inhibitor LprI family protein [Anderseniella sp. Alg231-50]|uniref:lysozyme inhibitor LprI family protein n=1 Tax=Anderseniella sp. Alg231-50 TaxID=1922226 RepID=UPI000D54DB37